MDPNGERPPPSNGLYYSRKDDERDVLWLSMNPDHEYFDEEERWKKANPQIASDAERVIGWFDEDNVFTSVKPYVPSVEWSVWPWRRCKAYLERKGDQPFWGRCEKNKGHDNFHALERGFIIVEFSTTSWWNPAGY